MSLPEIKLFQALNHFNHSCLSAGLHNCLSVQPLLGNATTPELKRSNLGKDTWILFYGEQGA